VACRDI
jgi:tetratricopeptide (TPR) repeat protein